jgi:hypothetical protein
MGNPWTKARGFMFFITFLIFKVVLAFSHTDTAQPRNPPRR